ncbi:glycosyltransferase family 8 protein [Hebeloma cylindrosporum]|uniref:Glycosyltransferase family 8 protein n=1 Tax=Hebeloma cylindrosporum TaxID=76867 RepID=A0A0C2YH13_HEBCY|nr:glycosyltransferase family 8 protein [Hebeloma cylindrosporum h7]
MWSEDAAAEGALLLKTILLYSTRPSDIHIICDDNAERLLRSRLDLVQNPLYHVRVWFYKPTWQSMLDRVEREGSIKTDHSAGLPGLMKLFIHEILPPTVKKSIYIDTDALFIANPALLWDVFGSLQPSTAIAMASHPDQNSPEWHHASRICSCVMLLDLEKLRNMRLMDSRIYREHDDIPALAPEAFKAKYGLPKANGRYDNVRLGDQGYWWAIVDHRRDLFEPLSYDFEVTSCLLDTYLTGLGNELTTIEEELRHQIHTKDTPQEVMPGSIFPNQPVS